MDRDGHFDNVTVCQTKGARMPVVAPKYGLVTGKGLLGRFAKYTLTALSSVSFPSALLLRPFVSLRLSFHTDGRNFTHPESHPFGL